MEHRLWTIELTSGQPIEVKGPHSIRLTNVSLGYNIRDENARTCVQLACNTVQIPDTKVGDSATCLPVLCSLIPGKIEQVHLNIILRSGVEHTFKLAGPNSVHLFGNYLAESSSSMPLPARPSVTTNFKFAPIAAGNLEVFSRPKLPEMPSSVPVFGGAGRNTSVPVQATTQSNVLVQPASSSNAVDGNQSYTGKDGEAKKKKKKAPAETPVVHVKDRATGAGPQVKLGDTIVVRCVVRDPQGTKLLDHTAQPLDRVKLHQARFDCNVVGMKVGGVRQLSIPPELGYGSDGLGDWIPPNTPLVIDFEIIAFENTATVASQG